MKKYSQEEIEIMKKAVNEYRKIKKEFDDLVNKGYSLKDLYNYYENTYLYVSDYDLNSDELKYIDINSDFLTLSIYDYKDKLSLCDEDIKVWNNNEEYFIGYFDGIESIEKIIKEDDK